MARSSSALVARWQDRLSRFPSSGQTVIAFCEHEGVSQASFYVWRKRLASPSTKAKSAPAGFRPVHVVAGGHVEVRLPGGTQIHVPAAELECLRAVVETIATFPATRSGASLC